MQTECPNLNAMECTTTGRRTRVIMHAFRHLVGTLDIGEGRGALDRTAVCPSHGGTLAYLCTDMLLPSYNAEAFTKKTLDTSERENGFIYHHPVSPDDPELLPAKNIAHPEPFNLPALSEQWEKAVFEEKKIPPKGKVGGGIDLFRSFFILWSKFGASLPPRAAIFLAHASFSLLHQDLALDKASSDQEKIQDPTKSESNEETYCVIS